MTVYADCHGLNKAIYEGRSTKRSYWGELPEQEEDEEAVEYEDEDDEDDSFEQGSDNLLLDPNAAEDELENIRQDLAFDGDDVDHLLDPNDLADEGQGVEDAEEDAPDFEQLRSGIDDLIGQKEVCQVLEQVEPADGQDGAYATKTIAYKMPTKNEE